MLAGACSSSSDDAGARRVAATTTTAPKPPPARPMAASDVSALSAQLDAAPGCDPLDTTACLLPFPSDHFTVADTKSDTGRRIALPTGQLANTSGAPLDPTEWNRNDGFSPGTPILLDVPHADLARSHLPTQGDIGASMADDSGSVLVDLDTGDRLPHWAELDTAVTDPSQPQLLILHPAAAFPDGHHIAVGFRHLRDASGAELAPTLAFRAYRDHLTTDLDPIESRRSSMERVFGALAGAGVDRGDLYAAWSFTVASAQDLTGRMVAMRDDAFAQLGDAAPKFTVDSVDTADLNPGIARLVKGTFQVPLYLTGQGEPGSSMTYGPDGSTPQSQGGTYTADYSCQIPTVALQGSKKARMVVYGHGLLGSHGEVENSQVAKIASTNDMIYCATDWIGMSSQDIGNAVKILGDLSHFSTMADRGQQGILNTLFLARLMIHDHGFASNAAFQKANGSSVVDGTEAYFDGNSQGALMGGAATAVAQDWTKAVLGVASMDYSILLSRSVDFAQYFTVLRNAYPNRVDQQIIYGLLQMLWDRIEVDGYAQHLTDDPLPDTPRHQVVLDAAFGDHQVANVTTEMEARTIGADIRQPALAKGRHPDAKPYYGLHAPKGYPTSRSLLVYWDSGTLPPPEANITPISSETYKQRCGDLSKDEVDHSPPCHDPHEDPRRAPGSIRQKDAFFRPDGKIIDPCDGKPCTAKLREDLGY
jgi:hypothetical protein